MGKGTFVVVFALIVLVAGCGGYGKKSGSTTSSAVTVKLGEQNGSGESGTATLTKVGNRTKVVVDLKSTSATPIAQAQPAHIHKGSCANFDLTPAYSLMSAQSGRSTTTVDAKLGDLQNGAYVINVHKSAVDINTYVACGAIGKGKSSGGSGGSGGSGYKY